VFDFIGILELGFATALSPTNLALCFLGCLVGTLIGVLPGVGPIASRPFRRCDHALGDR
jgi:putative tricarboxylic transport membrane protein